MPSHLSFIVHNLFINMQNFFLRIIIEFIEVKLYINKRPINFLKHYSRYLTLRRILQS